MKFEGGAKAAAKILAMMSVSERRVIIETIQKKDPLMAQEIERLIVTIEDLIGITPKMLAELLREVKIDDFGLALKLASDELQEFILSNISSSMKRDIVDILEGPQVKLSKVNESYEKLMSIVRSKVDDGSLVLKGSGEEYI